MYSSFTDEHIRYSCCRALAYESAHVAPHPSLGPTPGPAGTREEAKPACILNALPSAITLVHNALLVSLLGRGGGGWEVTDERASTTAAASVPTTLAAIGKIRCRSS